MNLVHEFTLDAKLKPPMPIGQGPLGQRLFFDVTEGTLKGERLNAKLLGGGEWALLGPDGFVRIDVRLQAQTDDDALLYIQYFGLLEFNDKVQTALSQGQGTDFGDQYFFTNPRIETGDERYAWLNRTFFVGQGHVTPGLGVEYRVFRPA